MHHNRTDGSTTIVLGATERDGRRALAGKGES